MVHPDDRDRFEQTIEESAARLQPWFCEFRLQRPDGETRWMSGNSVPRREADGSIIWHGLMSDITARKLDEQTLRRTTVLLERTNTLAHVGGWEYDMESEQLYLSNEVRRILGIDHDAGVSFEDAMAFYTRQSRSRIEAAAERAISSAEPYDLELQIVTARGETRWVRAQGEPVRAGDRTVALRGAFHDIHEQYTAREQLAVRAAEFEVLRDAAEAANLAKSEFIANMSHEIRTPLTAILGFAELLREQHADDPTAAERNAAVDTIATAGQHLLTVINDILDISKIEAGRMQIDLVEIDLPQLVREILALMRDRADTRGIRLYSKVVSTIPQRIITDPTRLRQMILNLLGNAIKFTDSGSVSLSIGLDGPPDHEMLSIEIEDTGPGIDPAQHRSLFSAFTQADSSLRRRHGGTGLGLAISRRCAELMGGTVALVRSEPGIGSCFRITLPVREAPQTSYTDSLDLRTPRCAATGKPGAVALKGRILFAEDGPDNQRLIAFHLRRAGAEVDIADNGRIALEMFEAALDAGEPYDLVLTDVQMPEMDGLELAAELRSRGISTPIIAVTAHAMTEDRARCIEAGCDSYTTKPVDRLGLLTTCRDWLGATSDRAKPGRAA